VARHKRRYDKDQVIEVREHICALAQVLEQERRKNRMKPVMAVKLSDDPRVKNLRIAPPALGDYDDLSE
jgi:hypothetical protein